MIDKKQVFVFVFGALFIFTGLIFVAGQRQGWWSPSVDYTVNFDNGDGIFVGTPVLISGLKAGIVKSVELGGDNKVEVLVRIQSKFASYLRQDTKARLGRPFIIGERVITLTTGSRDLPQLVPSATIVGEESLEITDMLSGGRMAPYFATFTKLLDQLRIVIEGDGSADSVNLVTVYKQAYLALRAVEALGKDVTVIRREFAVAPETKKILKDLAASSGELQGLLVQTNKALPAMTSLSSEVTQMMPQMTKTLNETVFTLQALQRSFILSGGVKALKKEKKEQEQEPESESIASERTPAGGPTP